MLKLNNNVRFALVSLTILSLAFLIYKSHSKEAKNFDLKKEKFLVSSLDTEKQIEYCKIFGRWFVNQSVGITTWQPKEFAFDSATACDNDIQRELAEFTSQLNSLTSNHATLTLSSHTKSSVFPLWRIAEIGSVVPNKVDNFEVSYFMVTLDDGCKYKSLHPNESSARKTRQALTTNYNAYFDKHTVDIEISHPEDNAIYSPYKSCI